MKEYRFEDGWLIHQRLILAVVHQNTQLDDIGPEAGEARVKPER